LNFHKSKGHSVLCGAKVSFKKSQLSSLAGLSHSHVLSVQFLRRERRSDYDRQNQDRGTKLEDSNSGSRGSKLEGATSLFAEMLKKKNLREKIEQRQLQRQNYQDAVSL